MVGFIERACTEIAHDKIESRPTSRHEQRDKYRELERRQAALSVKPGEIFGVRHHRASSNLCRHLLPYPASLLDHLKITLLQSFDEFKPNDIGGGDKLPWLPAFKRTIRRWNLGPVRLRSCGRLETVSDSDGAASLKDGNQIICGGIVMRKLFLTTLVVAVAALFGAKAHAQAP